MNFELKLTGQKELETLLNMLPIKARDAAHKELKTIALDLKGKAQQLAPIASIEISGYVGGDLAGSAFAEVNGLDAQVGFTEPYATRQHEEKGYRHSPGKQAKYLEDPYKKNIAKYIIYLGDAIKKAVE